MRARQNERVAFTRDRRNERSWRLSGVPAAVRRIGLNDRFAALNSGPRLTAVGLCCWKTLEL